MIRATLIALLFLLPFTSSHATEVWNEGTDGELSFDYDAPTDIGTLQIGSWEVVGNVDLASGTSAETHDRVQFTADGPWSLDVSGLTLSDTSEMRISVGSPGMSSSVWGYRAVSAVGSDIFGKTFSPGTFIISVWLDGSIGASDYELTLNVGDIALDISAEGGHFEGQGPAALPYIYVGETQTFSVLLTNNSSFDAKNLRVSFFDTGTRMFVDNEITSLAAGCNISGLSLNCDVPLVEAGQSVDLSFALKYSQIGLYSVFRTYVLSTGGGTTPIVQLNGLGGAQFVGHVFDDVLTDTDTDGVSDYAEGLEGTDPNDSNSTPGIATIDILALYPPGLVVQESGAHLTRINHSIAFANLVYSNSGIRARARISAYEEVNRQTPYADTSEAIQGMINRTAEFANLEQSRTDANADLIALFIDRPLVQDSCGKAQIGGSERQGNLNWNKLVGGIDQDLAHSLTVAHCSVSVAVHEIGHNLGLAHDRLQGAGGTNGTFDFARGHITPENLGTIMSYSPLGFWIHSNPELDCNGFPCGIDQTDLANGADATLVLNSVVYQAANYIGGPTDTDGDGLDDVDDLDDDGDGLPDYWEASQGLDPLDANDATLDSDGDQLSNLDEFLQGTDINSPDSDGDGTPDGADNCPTIANADQSDTDGNGVGDDCDGVSSKLLASDGTAGDEFGAAIALSQNTVIVGAPGNDEAGFDAGAAYVFRTGSAGHWYQQQKLLPTAFQGASAFGRSVAISGTRVLIGAPLDSVTGTATIYELGPSGFWSEAAKLVASNTNQSNETGSAVAIDGDTAVVGSFASDGVGPNSGAVYIFTRVADGSWPETQVLTASDSEQHRWFGVSVAIEDDTIVVGAENLWDNQQRAGGAYVFKRDGNGVWSEQEKLTARFPAANDHIGRSVAIDAGTVLTGASGTVNANDYESAHVFEETDNSVWGEQAALAPRGGPSGAWGFGSAVALDGPLAFAGAPADDSSGSDSGSLYVFSRSPDQRWRKHANIVAGDAAAGDQFGASIAVANGLVAVGAPGDDDNGVDSGSAYLVQVAPPQNVDISALPDINSDGIEDVAVLREGSILAEIRSGANGSLQKTMTFLNGSFTPISSVALPDSDGNGVAELGVLASRNSDGRIVVEMRNITGTESPRSVWFAPNHTPVGIAVVEDDADGNGVVELAVLSRRNSDGRGLVEVKNAFGATNPRALWAGAGLTSSDVEVLSDKDANGIPEIAILSTRNSDGRIVAEIKNAAGATLPTAVWFSPGHTAIDMVAVDDKDGNGVPEVAVLSSRDSDGRNVVEIKNAAGPTAPIAVWFAAGHTATDVGQIHDADNNGVPEVAVLSTRDSDGRILVEVKNAFGATNPNPLWYSPEFAARGFAVLGDTDSDGIEEALVLMIRDSDGRILVQGRNAAGSPASNDYWFSP